MKLERLSATSTPHHETSAPPPARLSAALRPVDATSASQADQDELLQERLAAMLPSLKGGNAERAERQVRELIEKLTRLGPRAARLLKPGMTAKRYWPIDEEA